MPRGRSYELKIAGKPGKSRVGRDGGRPTYCCGEDAIEGRKKERERDGTSKREREGKKFRAEESSCPATHTKRTYTCTCTRSPRESLFAHMQSPTKARAVGWSGEGLRPARRPTVLPGEKGALPKPLFQKNCLHLFPRPVRHAHALYYREKLHVRHESECTFWGFGQNWRLRRAARGCCKRRVVTADGRGKLPQRRLLPATFCARDTK